jgi:5-methylcytosine-specific restriction enzyme subunit McrC
VASTYFDINHIKFNYDRLSLRYKYIVDIALMILKNLVPLPQKNQTQSFAFLFDMGVVFESFIGKIYKSTDKNTKLQVEKNFGNLKLKPDIITSSTIIDTKYKKINSYEDVKTTDKYQMFAYGTNFERKDVILLYPKFLKDVDVNLKLGVDEKTINLKIKTIDLESDKEFGEYIEEIKGRVVL